MNRLESMATYVKVVERGSFIAAADEIGISSTMVGKHIRELEEHLSVKLLNRTTRQQNLTDAGRLYYEKCKAVLLQIAEAELDVREMNFNPKGILRVSAPLTFGAQCLSPAIAEYLREYPEVEVQLLLSDIESNLVHDNQDIAIRIGHLPESGLIARPLKPYKMVLCASPHYLEVYGTPLKPEDLKHHNCLAFHHHAAKREWRFLCPEGETLINVSGQLSINNGQGLRMAALQGVGIIMQPEVLLKPDLEAGRLTQILKEIELPARPMHIIYLRDKMMPPKIKSFINFILKKWGV
ncbi:LysR family transcriptional regulator [Acinetobacter qingfengensis]|uniref:LysR family transcriptional regulator n=1 Tax=Acinetobacter qingfengensis TaxID=1262585 RepID=A0A1E7QXG9_9GAMM|nr:LysR family transcriptional regulator [Acinetobacter qingfengensis]KAA8731660.1 LysR family transcriptional regulator [Acinetobacter qingfengensis]OEY91762.1 LysR family transcriptional regulator [Acinetobacter qingfengensis]